MAERDPAADAELDAAFSQGGDDALRLVYDRYGALVHTLCRRVVDPATSADVTQEVFVAAWRSRSSYDPGRGGLAGWLATIARNKLTDHFRSVGRRPLLSVSTAGAEGPSFDPTLDLDRLADRLVLADALAQLAPRARTVVELSFYQGLTTAEIAERCGLPLGTVKSDLRRSLERMRHHLGRVVGGDHV